jgi:hypothetical protein
MKIILIAFTLLSINLSANELGFTCKAEHRTDPVNKIFFNIIIDEQSYDKESKLIDIFVYHQQEIDMSYEFITVEAFYVSPSKSNPQYYIRAKNIPYYEHTLSFTVYPLARKMLGFSNLTITKNGISLEGTCERADYLDASS